MSDKTREDILKQDYISAKDLKILIPTLGRNRCIEIIKETIKEYKEVDKQYIIEHTKPLIIPANYILKKLNIKRK